MYTALSGHAALTDLVPSARIFDTEYAHGTTLPLVVYQRIPGTRVVQPVTGAVLGRSVRFQVKAVHNDLSALRSLAEALEGALVAAVSSFSDVTINDDFRNPKPESGLHEHIFDVNCLESA